MVTEVIVVGPCVPPQNREVALRDGGGSTMRVEDMLHKMMRFNVSYEHTKDLRSDLESIG